MSKEEKYSWEKYQEEFKKQESCAMKHYGWQCPKCGKVNAPWRGYCNCKEEEFPKKREIYS